MSADFDPMQGPAAKHFTKADPAAAGSLMEEFFKMQACHE